jgi:hypothetical protein
MGTARVMLPLSSTDAAYIAGIVDGEGTISLTRRHRNENRQLEVSISNTDIALLQFVKERVGAGRVTNKRTYRINHTASATYSISNRQALCLLGQLYPYLRTYKAERARMVLTHYLELTPRNGFYTAEIASKRELFIKEFLRANPLNRGNEPRPLAPSGGADTQESGLAEINAPAQGRDRGALGGQKQEG